MENRGTVGDLLALGRRNPHVRAAVEMWHRGDATFEQAMAHLVGVLVEHNEALTAGAVAEAGQATRVFTARYGPPAAADAAAEAVAADPCADGDGRPDAAEYLRASREFLGGGARLRPAPDPCAAGHDKCFSPVVLACHPPRRGWVCRRCRVRGTDTDRVPDPGEYRRLTEGGAG